MALLFRRGGVQATASAGCEASDSEDLKFPVGRDSGVYMVQEDAMMRALKQELNQIRSRGSSDHSLARPRLQIYALPSVLLTTTREGRA